jgi:2-C-methyl-D-erythritol 4-phosphate cytidylyltransferase
MIAIIVAAGSSRRMGFDKIFSNLAGEAVLAHSLRAFEKASCVERILVITKEERVGAVAELGCGFSKFEKAIPGGAERHHSVWAGLRAFDPRSYHYVGIHDGARPLISPDLIESCLALAMEHGGASCAAPVSDTVKRASPAQIVTESVDRTGLWAMQTPQIFRTSLILDAYEKIIENGDLVTDEVSAMQKRGREVALLRNEDWNLKITFPRDLEMAECIMELRRMEGGVVGKETIP